MSDDILTENKTENEAQNVVDESASGNNQVALPGWSQGLDSESKEDMRRRLTEDPKAFEGVKGLSDFYRGYIQKGELESRVFVPDKNATPEQLAAYRKAVGVPESPDGYAFEKPQLPEGMQYDETTEAWFKNTSHELGIPAQAASELFSQFNAREIERYRAAQSKRLEDAKKQAEERDRQVGETKNVLQQEWGESFPQRLAAANGVFLDEKIVPADLRQSIMDARLQNHPGMVKIMDLLAKATASDNRLGITAEPGMSDRQPGIDYGERFRSRYK